MQSRVSEESVRVCIGKGVAGPPSSSGECGFAGISRFLIRDGSVLPLWVLRPCACAPGGGDDAGGGHKKLWLLSGPATIKC